MNHWKHIIYIILLMLAPLLTATAAEARTHMYVGYGNGWGNGWGAPYPYYHHRHYRHYPYAYHRAPVYYAPMVVVPAEPMPAPAYIIPEPSMPVAPVTTEASDDYCREYTRDVMVGGKREQAYGHACRQEDGRWLIID